MRRNRTRSTNQEENKEEIQREVEIINEHVDFDDPKQIDFDLLVVSINPIITSINNVLERPNSFEGVTCSI